MTPKIAAVSAGLLAASTALVAAGPIEDYVAALITDGYSVDVEAQNENVTVLEAEQGDEERVIVLAADGSVLLDMPEAEDDDEDGDDDDDDDDQDGSDDD